MDKQAKSPTKQNVYSPHHIFKRKSLLFSNDDPERLAEESSKVKMFREFIQPDETIGKGYEEYLTKFSNLGSPYSITSHIYEPERNQFTTYPSRVCLRWNPSVDVSSGEEITDWRPRRKKSSCNCGNCTSRHCPSKKSSTMRPVFKDNIMTFSDKCTMTVKLNNVSCSAKTPLASPNVSSTSVRSSRSISKFQSDYYCPHSKSVYRKPCTRNVNYDDKQYYDEAVRDTDVSEDCPALRKAYARHCSTHNSGTQYGARGPGKLNLYNEGISDKLAGSYPIGSEHCPHRVVYGGKTFCMNKCPNCRCREPSGHGHLGKDSRYHQRCKVDYNKPVYYDQSTDSIRRVVAIPRVFPDHYIAPVQRVSRSPSIKLPKKVLTSKRDIEGYIENEHQCTYARQSRKKKSK